MLSHIRNQVDQDKKESLKTMLDTLEDWTRPKSDEVAAFTQLRARNQGNKTLSTLYPRSEESGRPVQFQLGHSFFIYWITLHLLKFSKCGDWEKNPLMYSSTPAEFFITFLTTFCHVLTLFLIAQ